MPFGQSFQYSDLGTVAFLILLEGLLSADNALVLAIMVKHLPKMEQQRALLYGLGGAFVFRFLAILFAAQIISFWWLQAIGALYLLWLPIKHFVKHAAPANAKAVGGGFWATVIAVELTDISFAIDSVLAGVSVIGGDKSRIWVVFFGAIIGIILLRFAAGFFVKLLEKFPALDHVAYGLVGWVGVKLALMAGHNFSSWYEEANAPAKAPFHLPEMSTPVFWGVLLSIAVFGTLWAVRHPASAHDLDPQAEALEDVQDLNIDDTGNQAPKV
ncbi:MAG: TerC family protein [Fimbriimonas sp.]